MSAPTQDGPAAAPDLSQQVADLQQELAAARHSSAVFFDHALALLCTAGFDGYFKQLNPMWTRTLGYSEDELRAEPFLSFVHPDDVAATLAAAEQLGSAGRDVISFENRYRCKDGSYRWLRWNSTPDMERAQIYAVVQDVTAARAAEDELRVFQQIFEHTHTGLMVLHLEDRGDPASLRLLSANPAAQRFSGIDLASMAGQRFIDIFPNAIASGLAPIYAEVARDGGLRDLGEARYADERVGDGVFLVRAFALPGAKVAVAFENVTERKRAEEATQRQGQLTALILDSMTEGVIAVDAAGNPTIFNPAAQRLFGAGPVEADSSAWASVYGNFLPDMVTPFPADALPMARALRGETTADVEMFVRHAAAPDGRWASVSGQPLRGPGGELIGAVVVCRDVTAHRAAEDALRQSLLQEEVIRAQRATLEELSTPLIPITDSVVVMPLIGAVDTRRAQQVLETLLEGIAQSKAEVAILDITGVSVVDTQVANALIRAAQAVKLLGAQVMLTGIRPEVAQTLVGLGVDLSGIITQSSLQRGIALAMGGERARRG